MFENLGSKLITTVAGLVATNLVNWLLSHGYIDATQTNDIIGSIVCLAVAGFTVFERMKSHEVSTAKVEQAEETTAAVVTVAASQGVAIPLPAASPPKP